MRKDHSTNVSCCTRLGEMSFFVLTQENLRTLLYLMLYTQILAKIIFIALIIYFLSKELFNNILEKLREFETIC